MRRRILKALLLNQKIKFSPLRRRENRLGVATILFVAIFGLLLGFFMMVANTGLLIYQKIKLQTAVDLAAYSGASVQAAYLGNDQSGPDSIRGINQQIVARYGQLLNDLQFGTVAPWPVGFPDPGTCIAACMAANLANGAHAASIYKSAAQDLEQYRARVAAILSQLPEVTRKSVEETIKLNIPDLSLEGSGGLGALTAGTTNEATEVVGSNAQTSKNPDQKRKNAILSFSTQKGMYLANVVAAVPHTFAYFGPVCFDANIGSTPPSFYCQVNGAGVPGGAKGFQAASLAFARVFAPAVVAGNIGNITSIGDSNANAIRLHFVPNTHKPDPWVTVAAEWYPPNGTFLNLENGLGAGGSLFPKSTRLVAVANAEPFGGNLASLSVEGQFGARLQSIRKNLLDPRVVQSKEDYPNLFDYFGSLSPRDEDGNVVEGPIEVIRRFLH